MHCCCPWRLSTTNGLTQSFDQDWPTYMYINIPSSEVVLYMTLSLYSATSLVHVDFSCHWTELCCLLYPPRHNWLGCSCSPLMHCIRQVYMYIACMYTCTCIYLHVGKKVVRLEYEAYISMAMKQLQQLCSEVREKWPICKLAIIHRIGYVHTNFRLCNNLVWCLASLVV